MEAAGTDYELGEVLYRSWRTTVYRARRRADSLPVVLKVLSAPQPHPRDLAQLRHEFRLARRLRGGGVIDVLSIESWGNNLALVEEDCGGSALASAVGGQAPGPLPLETFFPVALALGRVLSRIHAQAVHGDVSPANVLWNPSTKQLRLIDFGAASNLRRERSDMSAEAIPETSLPYVSPERSGRMNRDLDHRSDLYSLGATFYELLVGQPAFAARDRAEWIYCHVTRKPRPPRDRCPALPEVLSQIVLRLMAKNPEERYQSALGLLGDLEECERRWRSGGDVDSFVLGTKDVDGRLRISHKLRGRDNELEVMLSAFEEARLGAIRVVIVSGEAGVGKTALVNESRRAILRLGGTFIEGKCDQFQRHAPYAALASSFRQMAGQILAEPEDRLLRWTVELRDALGPNGRLVVNLVPELEPLIGRPAAPVAINPVEEQNRFQASMAALLRTFGRNCRPLVLFLDDLQWSDAPTLTLIERLLSDRDIGSFLLIGAYRKNEVSADLDLPQVLAGLTGAHPPTHLELGPLTLDSVNQLLAETLATSAASTSALARVFHDKTWGNPLLLGELLGRMHRDGILKFDLVDCAWRWDLNRARRMADDTDVGDLLLKRLRDLPTETQGWLRLAACVGARFDLRTLAIVADASPSAVAQGLSAAVADALVFRSTSPLSDNVRQRPDDPDNRAVDDIEDAPAGSDLVSDEQNRVADAGMVSGGHYQFQHDRVQQAAHALIGEEEQAALHLRIGRRLLLHLTPTEREARLIEIAHHLNEGAVLLASDEERLELAAINLEAARRARSSAAYRPAFELTQFGLRVLPSDPWVRAFDLTYQIHHLNAACAYLVGEVARAEAGCEELLRRGRTPLERAQVYAMQLSQLTFCERMDDAVAAGIRGLRLLGVAISARPSTATILKELVFTKRALRRRCVADLERAPVIDDPGVRLCMRILIDFIPPAYLTGNDKLFAAAVLQQTRLALKHGSCAESAAAYASYVVLLAGLGDLRGADEFGRLAMRLTERFSADESRCRNLVLHALFGQSWNRPWHELRQRFQEAVRAGLESGDLLFAAYACGWIHLWDPELDVKTAVEEGQKYLDIIAKTDYQNARDAALLSQQLWMNLLGHTRHDLSLSSASFDEEACQERMTRVRNVSGLGIHALYRIKLALIYGEYEHGFEIVQQTRPLIRALAGSPYLVEYALHAFLICASVARQRVHRLAALRQMRRLHVKMKRWAKHAPDNFGQHALLMDAEWAALRGQVLAATRLYERAIAAARRGRFARYEALANERAAGFFAALGLEKLAIPYLDEARYHYARWGATAKVRRLDEAARLPGSPSDHRRWQSSFAEASAPPLPMAPDAAPALDTEALWKASQAVSEEVNLDKLVGRLVVSLCENAGATRVSLLLTEPGDRNLLVQAEVRQDGVVTVMQRQPAEQADIPLSVVRYVMRSGQPLVVADVARDGELATDPYWSGGRTGSMLAMPVVHRGEPLGVLYVENSVTTHAFDPERLSTLRLLASQAAISLQNARLYESIQRMADSFSRFVPREFLRSLGRTQLLDIRLGESVQKVMTVLFSDIRGFTSLVERMSPTDNIGFLNSYISHMEPAILAHGGFVDSYVGDGIIALFDGPAERAVATSTAMLRALDEFNAERATRHGPRVAVGLGLNTGLLTLGTIGGAERLKCGVIGDTVNVAARIESLTKRYGVQVLISGSTHALLPCERRASTRFVDRVRVAGHLEPVDLYEVFDADPVPSRDHKLRSAGPWQEAMDLYYARRFDEASRAFRALRSASVLDPPADLFEERARRLGGAPPGDGWNGVEIFTEK